MKNSFGKFLFVLIICLMMILPLCSAASAGGINVGDSFQQFSLNALDGSEVAVVPAGKVLIVNFWATWCPPCRREMPEFNEFYLQYGKQVTFYTINCQEDVSKVNAFMQNNNFSMPTLLDSNGVVGKLYQVQGIPTTIVVDKNGVIQFRQAGSMSKAALENVVKKLL